jgi:hypothetical protein
MVHQRLQVGGHLIRRTMLMTTILEARNVNRFKARMLAGIAVTAALLVPLAIFGAPALAGSGAAASEYQYGGSGSAQYQYRVTICHLTGSKKHPAHTIVVSSASVAAHLRHGDHLGPCTGTEKARAKKHTTTSAPTTGAPTTSSPTPNPGAGHGKGHHK